MLKSFEEGKTYRLLTFEELEKREGIIKTHGNLMYPENDFFYEAMMDKIPTREFCADDDETYDLNEIYTVVPWMCEEVTQK